MLSWNLQVLQPVRLVLGCLFVSSLLIGPNPIRRAGAQSTRLNRPSARGIRIRPVADTTQYPWSAVCKIIATFPDQTTVEGSGTMIGPHHCLTALHLIYDTKTRTAAKRVRIVPGYDDDRLLVRGLSSRPFGTTRVGQFLFWEPHDIAIIVTDTNIGDNSSWLTVGSRSNHELLDRNYIVAGYSGASNGSERQGEVAVTVGSVEGDRVRLSIETPPGMEGGPIFERAARGRPGEPDVWAIVGVQIGANRGMRIPDEMRRILDRFLRDDFSGVNANIPLPRR